jgi:hypothetical protein
MTLPAGRQIAEISLQVCSQARPLVSPAIKRYKPWRPGNVLGQGILKSTMKEDSGCGTTTVRKDVCTVGRALQKDERLHTQDLAISLNYTRLASKVCLPLCLYGGN